MMRLLLRIVAHLEAFLLIIATLAQLTTPVRAIHHHSHAHKTTSSSNHHKKREKDRENHHNHEWPILDKVVEQTSSSTSTVSKKYPYESPHKQYGQRRRQLQDEEPECGAEIGRVTIDEITQLMNLYLTFLVDSSTARTTTTAETDATLLESAITAFLSVIQYDLVAFKVCGSCANIWDNHDTLDVTADLNMTGGHGFSTYCAPWSYGYEALHSALVFAPIDPETDSIFSDAVLRVAMAGRSVRVTVADAPSASWPASVLEVLSSFSSTNTDDNAELLTQFRSYIAPLMSATAGAIAIVPDFLGFGASQNYNRTFLTPRPYQQAFVVSYFATQDYFDKHNVQAAAAMSSSNSSTTTSSTRTTETAEGGVVSEGDSTSVTVGSNGVCTLVDRVASLSGYSEGGYAALVGALALEQMGVRILSTHIGGAPLNLELQLGAALDRFTEEQSVDEKLFMAYFAYAYSNDFPLLANAQTGQNLLHPNWDVANNVTRNVRSWFAVGDETKTRVEISELLRPANVTYLVNLDVRVIYNAARANGVLDACRSTNIDGGAAYMTETTNQLCQALVDATLWDELSTDVSFPTVICHSPDDEVVGQVNVPSVADNPFVTLYDPILPALVPGGTHAEAEITCALDPVTVIAFGEVDTPVQMATIAYLLLQEEPSRTVPAFCKQITIDDMGVSNDGDGKDVPSVAPAYYDEKLFDQDSGGSFTLLTWSIPGLALTLVMGNIWC